MVNGYNKYSPLFPLMIKYAEISGLMNDITFQAWHSWNLFHLVNYHCALYSSVIQSKIILLCKKIDFTKGNVINFIKIPFTLICNPSNTTWEREIYIIDIDNDTSQLHSLQINLRIIFLRWRNTWHLDIQIVLIPCMAI